MFDLIVFSFGNLCDLIGFFAQGCLMVMVDIPL
jgi:hypothetical protein